MNFFFFFQAEDGIRDKLVTGVQTCALPILNGLAEYYRHRDQLGPGDFDRLLDRVGDETARIGTLIDALARIGPDPARPPGPGGPREPTGPREPDENVGPG